MKIKILPLVFVIFLFFLGVSIVFAASFTADVTPQIADSGVVNKTFNFTITNSGPGNITKMNITFPDNFGFVNNTNGTTAVNLNFTNTSTAPFVLIWQNTTPEGFVNSTDPQHFWFNISVPKNIGGTYYFNVSTWNNTNHFNSTNVSITIERTVWSSPNKTFYVKPVEVFLNWTNMDSSLRYISNITVITNNSYTNDITIQLLNYTLGDTSPQLKPNYTQTTGGGVCDAIPLSIRNSTGDYNNTEWQPLNSNSAYNQTNITLIHTHPECYPGRYYTSKFIVRNRSSSEDANITVYLDIPISTSNTLNNVTGRGSFNGQLPANATTYHSFFFNASNSNSSQVHNATSVFINVTSTSDVDVFLFDNNGALRAKAINKTAGDEIIRYNYLTTTDEMWEIRIFGNSSTSVISYSGVIILSGLNATDTSGNSISTINFGRFNVTSNSTENITLSNMRNVTISEVVESKEFYLVNKFSGVNASNFTILVPDSSIVNKLKVSLNWNGSANYSFSIYNHANALVGRSIGKHRYANVTGATQEEYNETTSIGSTAGIWRIEVTNHTQSNDTYELATYLYVASTSSWIKTNFTSHTGSSILFNRTGHNNSTYGLRINLTVPTTAMNGTYEGYLQYLDSQNAGIKVPLRIEVTTPVLVINDTMSSDTYRLDENYGANLTRTMYFNISNPSDMVLNLTFTNSSNLTSGGWNATLDFNTTESVAANGFSVVNVNITFNQSMPVGVYTGWIKVNATNATENETAHPYPLYTINLQLNLTNLLDVRISQRSHNASFIVNTSQTENITVKADIYYLNGTGPITDLGGLSNFTAVWLEEDNVTGTDGRIPTNGSLTRYNATTNNNPPDDVAPYCNNVNCPTWGGYPHYYINATIPSSKPGGRYYVNLNVSYKRDSFSFSGTGTSLINETLVLDNTGLYMRALNSTDISIANGSSYYYHVNVSNFGPKSGSSATIIFNIGSCTGYTAAVNSSYCDGWSVSQSGATFTMSPPGYNTSCRVVWKITGGSSAASACISNITGGGTGNTWFNPYGINISVTVTAAADGGADTTTTGAAELPTYVANLSFTKAESIVPVVQGASNTTEVQVKNIGNKTQSINFTIADLNSSWYTINATNASLLVGRSAGFLVTFTVEMIDVKDYAGKYKAYSSETSVTSDFVVRVLPATAKQVEINNTLALYRVNMTKAWDEINRSKTTGVNTTLAEEKIIEAKNKIELAESYIAAGNYFDAYQLFATIKSLIDDAKTELEIAKKVYEETHLPSWLTWALVAAGIGVGGFLIYLFWPQPGYSAKTGRYTYKTPKERSVEALSEAKEKVVSKVLKPTAAYKSPFKESFKLAGEVKQPITKVGKYTIEKGKTAQEKVSEKFSEVKRLLKKKRKYEEVGVNY